MENGDGTEQPAAADDPGLRTFGLPPTGMRRATALLGRALSRRCPYCGGGNIFKDWFALRDRCPTCGVAFDREEGYFLGGYAINLIVAEFLAVGIVVLVMIYGHLQLLGIEAIGVGLTVGLPILFFPYSRTLWMALDLLVDPPERQREQRLRSHEMSR